MITARRADIGVLQVARVLPHRDRRMVGPYVFLDHAGPMSLAPGISRAADIGPHPHIGLSTLSYLFAGTLMHRDSTGAEQAIAPGEVNWMTAGRGVSHSERFEGAFQRLGGELELLQAWVALPEADEEVAPSFQHVGLADLPTFEEDGRWGRLVVGAAWGLTNPVAVRSPQFYVHLELEPGAATGLPTGYPERALYVVRGEVEVAGLRHGPGQLLVFAPEAAPTARAVGPATVMLLGGEPVGPRRIWWNFVSSRLERIEQAKADWAAGRIALPIHDDRDFVPLPG